MGSLKTRVGLLLLLRVGRHVSNIVRSDLLSRHLVSAGRREAAVSAPVPFTKVQALELLKGDLDGELFLAQRRRRMLCFVNGLRRTKPRSSKISWI